jgi:hypothetical protein
MKKEAGMTERRDEISGKQEDATHHPGDDEHGWAPDEKGSGATGSESMAEQAGNRAFEARDTQDSSRGTGPNPGQSGGPGQAPEGVGESISRRGEDVGDHEDEGGREAEGGKGPTRRPVGTSNAGDSTGVDPQEPIHEESPTMPAGDQGG